MKTDETNSNDLDNEILKLMKQKEEENKALVKILQNIDEILDTGNNVKKNNEEKPNENNTNSH